MPVMNFDLEDGLPPVSFSINGEGAQRFIRFAPRNPVLQGGE